MNNEKKQSHITEIDYLRGIAILLTLFAHFAFMQGNISTLYLYLVNNVAQFWGGVYLFFVISGYVISRSFMANFEAPQAATREVFLIEWKKFYIRRFFRIVPTAITWILVTILLALLCNAHGSFGTLHSVWIQASAASIFVYNAFTPWIAGAAFGIYWSLSFEEQFYLLFPWFSRQSEKFKLNSLVIIILLFTHIHRPADQHLIMVSFPLDAISWGVLIAMIQRNSTALRFEPLFLIKKWAAILNQVLMIAIIIFSPILLRNFVFGTSVLAFAAAWLVFCASFNKGYIISHGIFGDGVRQIGIVSFSLYCAHMPSFLLARELTLSLAENYAIGPKYLNGISFILAASLCLLLTSLSYRFIEKPTRRLGARFSFTNVSINQLAI